MIIDLQNLKINSPKTKFNEYLVDPDRSYRILTLKNQYNTVVVKNMTVDSGALDISLLGFGCIPNNLIIENCVVNPNFTFFDEGITDFAGFDYGTVMENFKVSGKMLGGSVNLPDILNLCDSESLVIKNVDVAEFEFKQVREVDSGNEVTNESFANAISILTIKDSDDSRMFVDMLKRRYQTNMNIKYV